MEQREQVATTAQARRLEHSNSTTRNNPMKASVSDSMTNDHEPFSIMQGMEDTVWRVGCYNINPTTPNGQEGFSS